MIRKRAHDRFIDQLKRTVASLKNMKPNDMHVITVHANYGNYELVIGPEKVSGSDHNRPVEINGEIHHLFISHDHISPNPTKEQIHDKLKDTIIMQDLEVHLHDPDGGGMHAYSSDGSHHGVEPHALINMAGHEGEEIIHRLEDSGELNDITYQIIQDDILHALEKNEEEQTLES